MISAYTGTQIRAAEKSFLQASLDAGTGAVLMQRAAYGLAKARLFAWPGLKTSVINADDSFGQSLIDAAKKRGQRVLTYGLGSADVRATGIAMGRTGIWLSVATPWGDGETTTQVVGAFNVDNLLGTLAVLLATDVPLADALEALSKLTPPPGRMQRLGGDGKPLVVVDYAHTPDALEKALTALRPLVGDGGELVCVFGAGGPHVDEWAEVCGTINYEIVARMGSGRIARVYDGG